MHCKYKFACFLSCHLSFSFLSTILDVRYLKKKSTIDVIFPYTLKNCTSPRINDETLLCPEVHVNIRKCQNNWYLLSGHDAAVTVNNFGIERLINCSSMADPTQWVYVIISVLAAWGAVWPCYCWQECGCGLNALFQSIFQVCVVKLSPRFGVLRW